MEKSNVTSSHSLYYGSDEAKSFAENSARVKKAFLDPTVGKFLEMEASGKKILDIGCGTGDWSYQAARYGAKRVDGFDKHEKMMELAKQATSQFDTVNIRSGDVMNMPYDDNTFDVAISIFVTCELPIEIIPKHFKELHRVLVPGGKALVLNYSKAAFQTNLIDGANEATVQKKIDQILTCLPDRPTQQQISKAFKDSHEAVCVCFAYDKNGSLFQVKNMKQLVNGQAVVVRFSFATFHDFYYDDEFLLDQTRAAGLQIDQIENAFTEERRIVHNSLNPDAAYSKKVIDHPFYLLYHISKAT